MFDFNRLLDMAANSSSIWSNKMKCDALIHLDMIREYLMNEDKTVFEIVSGKQKLSNKTWLYAMSLNRHYKVDGKTRVT